MKKLTTETAKFAILRTAYHGGGTVSLHNSLNAAIKNFNILKKDSHCICGCFDIVPITETARTEMKNYRDENGTPIFSNCDRNISLYNEYDEYTGNESPYQICK